MKCDSTNCILTFVLGVLAVAGVIFALQTIFLTRDFRQTTADATLANTGLLQAQALANDVALYNQKTPDPQLTKILQSTLTKPATH